LVSIVERVPPDLRSRKKGHKKKGKHLLSHRYNPLPLLRSHPGGVQEELVVKDLPRHKYRNFMVNSEW